jgi:hypothetical protein
MTGSLVFLGVLAALVMIGFAWTFAPRDGRFVQSWIDRTGRRASATKSAPTLADDDRPGSRPKDGMR